MASTNCWICNTNLKTIKTINFFNNLSKVFTSKSS